MDLELYYMPSCPYCRKVLKYLQDNNIDVNLKNITESASVRDELIDIGGKPQVPCLVIDGDALYESDDIVAWFDQHKEEL